MPAVFHVLRRGAVYYWRRRFPAAAGTGPGPALVVSLGTKDLDEARRLAATLTFMSERILDDVARGELSPEEARAIMLAVAADQIATLKRAALADRSRSQPEPMSGARADRVLGAAYRLLAERGRAATLGSQDENFLRACGLAPSETLQVQMMLEVLRRQKLVPAPIWKIDRLLSEHAPEVEKTTLARAAAETALYRGKAAACMDTESRWGDTLDADIELIRAAATGAAPSPVPAADATPAPQPALADEAAEAPAIPQASAQLDPPVAAVQSGDLKVPSSISGLAGKLVETRGSRERWTAKTARQMASTAALLVRVVGHDEFARLRQQDFAIFRDVLGRLPVSYGKSSRDREKPISEILAAALRLPANRRGREAGTINRHFNHLGALLKFASGYGLNCAEPIDLSYFYEPNTERARDQRPAMTLDDVTAILQSSVWSGSVSEVDRLNAGEVVIHDALYWVPLIAIYSLMRREEACGLRIDDVRFDAAIPCFILAPNRYRRLKNLQSKRKVPIHPELLRLGLRRYVEAIKALGYDLLFPELLPASGDAPLGDQFHDLWSPLLQRQIPNASETGKVFHSLRHWGNQALSDAKVSLEWRRDIMGHGGVAETDERYRDDTRMKNKLVALLKLPKVSARLEAFPVRLRESARLRIARSPRGRIAGAR
jgi:integrase